MSFLLVVWLLAPLGLLPLGFLLMERRRLRLMLSDQQRILEATFTGSASGLALLDLQGRLLRVNRALCELTGYPEQALLGLSFGDLTYPDDLAESVAQFRRLVAGEIRSYQLQKRYVHRSGHLSWALVTSTLIRESKGLPRFCVVQVQEISESKREAEALAHRERLLTKTTALSKLASWEWDLSTDTVTWSESTYQVFGRDPHAFEPHLESYLSCVHPEDRELIRSSLEQAQQDHLPFSIEQRILQQGGEQRIVLVRGAVEVGTQGQALRLHGSVQDVTESRHALDDVLHQAEECREARDLLSLRNAEAVRQLAERDQDLQARDRLFRRILNHVPAAVAYFDDDGACQWMSPEALARFGFSAEQVSMLSAEDVPLLGHSAERFEAVMAAGEPYRERGIPLTLRQNGLEQLTYWDYSLIPCRSPEGEHEGLLAFAREVTDRIEKEKLQEMQIKTLEASEKLKDHYLNTLTHEIRSPLTVILGAALLFQGEALGPLTEKQRLYVAKLIRNGRELTRLVNNVLESNLLRSGQLELYPEPLAFETIMRDVVAELAASAILKGIQVRDGIAADLPRVMADRRRLAQIGLNLVSNAVQYAPQGATVTISARIEADRLLCEVFNSGSRIPPEKLPDLFTAVDRPGNGQKGLGLGLGLSRALAEAHGGNLGVLSQEEGVTAWFSLPVGGPLPV